MKFLVTAGPTREPLDPVRYLSNRSSGKMGYAIAAAAHHRGHQVTLISGPTCLTPPTCDHFVQIETARQLQAAILTHLDGIDCVVMCAAVADYRPATTANNKLKKDQQPLESITLVENPDILAELGHSQRNFLLVGFAAESENLHANANAKLRKKCCDIIVANYISGEKNTLDSDINSVLILGKDGSQTTIEEKEKLEVAKKIIQIIESNRQ